MRACGKIAELKKLPTVMDIGQEIAVMHDLMELTPEDVLLNYKDFDEVIDNLWYSHMESGSYQLTEATLEECRHFSTWLYNILIAIGIPDAHAKEMSDCFWHAATDSLS